MLLLFVATGRAGRCRGGAARPTAGQTPFGRESEETTEPGGSALWSDGHAKRAAHLTPRGDRLASTVKAQKQGDGYVDSLIKNLIKKAPFSRLETRYFFN